MIKAIVIVIVLTIVIGTYVKIKHCLLIYNFKCVTLDIINSDVTHFL